ncbi:hypothetical protein GCM10010965_22330 [Caldalkalibacillus thermarum]|uniref:glycosyltransferase family 4 protein n=1 Tax=Caldalkalibacillus thermarum TaxID=296745 RepID=UPI0016653F3C|nr:glycosyltransferase family 4 protein [Caldalkalibacillus thermarum]GGK29016.1 hypothetical protein GCM10010965_22330 [Caldalkalibacillus thermarum]
MNVLMLLFKDIHYDARVKREAVALAEAGHQVTIACLEEYPEDPPVLHERVELLRLKISTKRIRRSITNSERGSGAARHVLRIVRTPVLKLLKDILASQEYYRHVKAWLRQHPVDVIHCHDLNTLPAGTRLARRFGTRLVYDSHELFNEMAGKNALERRVGYWVENRLIRHIDHLIVVNPFVKKEFFKRYGPLPTTVIQNTPVLPDFGQQRPDDVADLRCKYGLCDDDVLLIYQGGLNPERGLEECIQAVALLPERFKLVLMGDGRLKENLQAMVDELGLNKRVFFHEPVPSESLLWYTKQADVGLVIYKNTCLNNYYSTPNKIFEYLLAGIPTVASDHPGKRYVVEGEGTGICVAETPEAIKAGILEVINRLDAFKQNCVVKRTQFCWQKERDKLVKMYQQLGAPEHEQQAAAR